MSITLDIPCNTLNEAVKTAFGCDIGKNVYVTLFPDGLWHVTVWDNKAKDAIYLCFPVLSENDPEWLEATL